MKTEKYTTKTALFLILVTMLSGCVYTDSNFKGDPEKKHTQSKVTNASNITISETDIKGRKYVVLGDIDASARSINLLSSNPTREDINEELRAKAFKIGADAVILIKYQTQSQGLATRGHLTGSGSAVSFLE